MTHSILVVDERHEIFGDFYLLAIIHFLAESSEGPLRRMFYESLEAYTPGAIDLDIQVISNSWELKSQLADVIDKTHSTLQKLSEETILSLLIASWQVRGIKVYGLEKAKMLIGLDQLKKLIN